MINEWGNPKVLLINMIYTQRGVLVGRSAGIGSRTRVSLTTGNPEASSEESGRGLILNWLEKNDRRGTNCVFCPQMNQNMGMNYISCTCNSISSTLWSKMLPQYLFIFFLKVATPGLQCEKYVIKTLEHQFWFHRNFKQLSMCEFGNKLTLVYRYLQISWDTVCCP